MPKTISVQNPRLQSPKLTQGEKIENHRKLWLFVIVVIFFLALVFFFFIKPSGVTKNPSSPNNSAQVGQLLGPSPTPFPFQEMTIPYLREKRYESTLGDLELYVENGSYRSYLTSYTSDGLRINGLLTVPIGDEQNGGWPAVVFVHGYIPPTQYTTTDRYVDYVDFLARNGFVVLKIDLRGHGSSEGDPGGAYYSSDYIIDTLSAYEALASSDFVNPSKIGLWGHSMAGNVVLRSLAARPEIPAAVIWAGAVYSYEDWQKYRISDDSYRPPQMSSERQRRREQLFKAHGQFSNKSPFWRQVAPTNYLSDLKGAIQLNHAMDDEVVNIGYSRDLNALLNKTSVPHEFYEYPSGGHNISDFYFTQAMQNTVDFFKKYLQ